MNTFIALQFLFDRFWGQLKVGGGVGGWVGGGGRWAAVGGDGGGACEGLLPACPRPRPPAAEHC